MLLLLFGGGLTFAESVEELVQSEPLPGRGFPIQRPAVSGEWRFAVELADTQAGGGIVWHDVTQFYAGDRHQFGAAEYRGRNRARLVEVQLQIDNVQAADLGVHADILAPWGLDTTDLFGVDVTLDAGLLMRASLFRVVGAETVEWNPLWTGRVETWGDASYARGQTRVHIVNVIDTISDLVNVPTTHDVEVWLIRKNDTLAQANWLFGDDNYNDTFGDVEFPAADTTAIQGLDIITDPLGLVWRSQRNGRLVIHPAPWDTQSPGWEENPLLTAYPDGLVFSYNPDITDIEYIVDDDQQPPGVQRTNAAVINAVVVTTPSSPPPYATDDPISIQKFGYRVLSLSWQVDNEPAADDLLASLANASVQATPIRTTLDHEGFWSAMAMVDHLDPVTLIHATSDDGPVITAVGYVRNVLEERTFRREEGLNWQSTVQIDITSATPADALLPVEDLALEFLT